MKALAQRIAGRIGVAFTLFGTRLVAWAYPDPENTSPRGDVNDEDGKPLEGFNYEGNGSVGYSAEALRMRNESRKISRESPTKPPPYPTSDDEEPKRGSIRERLDAARDRA